MDLFLLLEVAKVHFEFDAGRRRLGCALLRRLTQRLLSLCIMQHRSLHPAPHRSVRVKEALKIKKRMNSNIYL